MYTTHFWYQFYLHGRKIGALVFVTMLCCAQPLKGQMTKQGVTMHRLESDKKKFQYGFFLGTHSNALGLKYAPAFDTPAYDEVKTILSPSMTGFNLGFMVNVRLDDQFTMRLVPVKVALYQQALDYEFTDGTTDKQLIESTRIEPGLFFKYRSIRRNNTRMYLVAGISGSLRSGKEEMVSSTDRLEIRRFNLKAEIGLGLEKYFKFFKLSPEIRYARGLTDVLLPSNNFYHNGIGRLVTHNFSLYFHFSD